MMLLALFRLALLTSTCDERDYAPSERAEAMAYCAEQVLAGAFDREAGLVPDERDYSTAEGARAERFPEVAPLGASGMLRVDADADAAPADEECAQY